MSDYITRDDARKALFIGEQCLYSWDEIEEKLEAIPAADVRPVVICAECKHYNRRYWDDGRCYGTFCDLWRSDFGKEGFCYRGEKREVQE